MAFADRGNGAGAAAGAPSDAPVVEIVFDELPSATLMTPSGKSIDAKRFPGFAQLAAHSTWYRDNTTVADFTGRAVPAIETGTNPGFETLPTAEAQPHSIFSLLGGRYRFNVTEPVTDICPRSLCGGKAPVPSDAPSGGDFAQDVFVPPTPGEYSGWLRRIRGGPRSLNFIHFEVPHEPFHFLPNGRSYEYTPISDVATSNAQRWAGGVGGTAMTWQRHYIQTGYADTLVARTIRRLKQVGIWKRAMLVVTADHGISFDPHSYRRLAVKGNFGGIANPPLFIKYPGQTRGEVSAVHSRTIDILPTIAQALGIELPFQVEGVPISQDSEGGTVEIANGFKEHVAEPLSEMLAERRQVLKSAATQLGVRTGIFQLGPRPQLLGRRGRASSPGFAVDPSLSLGDASLGGGHKVPALIDGTAPASADGKVVAIAVNGKVVATCRAFRFGGRTRWAAVVPPSSLHRGANTARAFLAG
jgi:Sulfatase